MGSMAEEAMVEFFSCPDVGGASEEADAESARMPQKQKADDEDFQNPTTKKSKQAESSSEALFPPRWHDFGWERTINFLTCTKLKIPDYYSTTQCLFPLVSKFIEVIIFE
jgi:hypothetical protein